MFKRKKMPIILPTKEDKEKIEFYKEIYNEMFGDKKEELTSEEISQYTRKCINPTGAIANSVKGSNLKFWKRKSFHLEDILLPKLFEIAVEHEESDNKDRRVCDKKAMKLIRTYCKGSFEFVREYWRFYKNTKKMNFYIP